MAKEFSFPFDAMVDEYGEIILNDFNEPDRLYSSEDFARDRVIFYGNGVFPKPSTGLQIMGNHGGLYVTAMKGSAHVNGRSYLLSDEDDEVKRLVVQLPHPTFSRKDIVVLGCSNITRDVVMYIKTGIPSGDPREPPLTRTADVWELQLAIVNVRANTQEITQADITDTRMDENVCGWVTGNFPPLDTTSLYIQMQDWLNRMIAQSTNEFRTFMNMSAAEFKFFMDSQIDLWREWVNDLRGLLSGDIAGNLAIRITDVQLYIFVNRDMNSPLHWPHSKNVTTFSGETITTTISDATTNVKQAEEVTVFAGDVINSVITYYEANGVTIAVRKPTKTTFTGDAIVSNWEGETGFGQYSWANH